MITVGPSAGHRFDVIIIGGGPAGSTIATVLSQRGLRVAAFERERFPRFHIGESLLPANLPIFDRLGCHEAIRQAGFLIKPGATYYDEYEGRGQSVFAFQPTPFQPAFAYNVVRATFDDLLLRHAEQAGATIYREHLVQHPRIGADGVQVCVSGPDGVRREIRAQMLVDASGRAACLGNSLGERQPLPDLGKVSMFAHFRNACRDATMPDGNIRIYLLRDGWAWWIPFANGTDSIGCVVHARVAKARQGSMESLFETMLSASPRLAQGLAQAQRITPVHTTANFSYRISPIVGHRYLAIGDATGFVDPIFSAGVFVAMRSAELAATTILEAFRKQDFRAVCFRRYATQLRQGVAPFLSCVRRFYEPAFLDLFLCPEPSKYLYQAVLWVLSGAAFDHRPMWIRGSLALFFGLVSARKAARLATGLPTESRWRW